ncbi:MAG TPA: monovalent cation/H(+) antiporter subunit G [Terriglobales bacterium]|nr:monovalent cation/H(+) antiporter subunit G [Terriglobales bacterium]
MTGTVWIFVLLAIVVLISLVCCIAIATVSDFYVRLHYLAPVTTVAFIPLLIAVIIHEGAGQAAIKTILVFGALLLINAVLTHATARAARVRQLGHWSVDPQENIEGAAPRG